MEQHRLRPDLLTHDACDWMSSPRTAPPCNNATSPAVDFTALRGIVGIGRTGDAYLERSYESVTSFPATRSGGAGGSLLKRKVSINTSIPKTTNPEARMAEDTDADRDGHESNDSQRSRSTHMLP